MQPLDLKNFVWVNDDNETFIILAITNYNHDDVVVYRESRDRQRIFVDSVSDFCNKYEATYELLLPRTDK